MAAVPIALQITTSTDEDNRTDSDTNLSAVDTKDKLHTDFSTWTPAERKKLQHMNSMKNISVFLVKRPPSKP